MSELSTLAQARKLFEAIGANKGMRSIDRHRMDCLVRPDFEESIDTNGSLR